MKAKVKKLLSFVPVCLMLFGIMPAGIELPTKAQAAGVPGYNAVAAVEWAKAHVNDTWSCLYGRGYWEPCTGDPVVVAPKCHDDGYTLYTCTIHKNETKTGDTVHALGHEPDNNWYITKVPTCTEKGEEECKCLRHNCVITCDKTFTRETDAYSHSMTKTPTSAPTCLNDGNSEYWFCDRWNKYFSDENGGNEIKKDSWIIPATGHDYKKEETVPPTCVKAGYVLMVCANDSSHSIKVKRYNNDSTYTLLACAVKDGIVTLTTDHFCTFEFVITADCKDRVTSSPTRIWIKFRAGVKFI